MVEKFTITIPELTEDEPRGVYVYLPEDYYFSQDQRYPVLYMFDGHNLFFDSDATYGKSWGLKDYMDGTQTKMIIAAIECNHSPDHGRLKEYTPFSFHDPSISNVKIDAKGDITMEWLVHTFKPMIDQRYRTLSDRENTFIAGSSMGGLMTIYALLKYNNYFSAGAALSPSIWVAPVKLASLAKTNPLQKTAVYLSYGEEEFSNHEGMRSQFTRFASSLINDDILVTCRIVPGGKHCEACWEKEIPFFMNVLLSCHANDVLS